MRFAWIIALALAAGLALGCSSSDSTEGAACSTSLDCERGFACMDETCQQIVCESTPDCPGQHSFCKQGADDQQPEVKVCTPVQCKTGADCPDGEICDEFKQCIAGDGPGDVTTEMTPETDVKEDMEPGDVPATAGASCKSCNSDADCDGLKCYPLGGGTFCFGDCEANDDCDTGWMCYQLTNESKQCIPLAFNCEATCLAEGCPEGKMCNQDTGECVAGSAECAPCQQDWDCATGYRCYQEGKYCAAICGEGSCPTNSLCQTVNTIQVNLCVSQSSVCCYGADCQQCPPETPVPYNGECVECVKDEDCGEEGKTCSADKLCQDAACPDPAKPFLFEGNCVQCLNSSHCTALGPDKVCNQANHTCSGEQPDECNYCPETYPACTQINGVWSCVQCTDDSYCNGGTCDLTLYACAGGGIGGCGACTNDSQCLSAMGDKTLKCDPDSGCCYDVAGWCDGVESMCNEGGGSECIGIMDLLMGGMGGIPGMPEGMALGLCSCDEPMTDMMAFAMCALMGGSCPSGGCFGDAICIDTAMIQDFLPLPMEGGVCVNLQSLIGMLLP